MDEVEEKPHSKNSRKYFIEQLYGNIKYHLHVDSSCVCSMEKLKCFPKVLCEAKNVD